MKIKTLLSFLFVCVTATSFGQIGTRFPSEKKTIKDPITGQKLIFLTTKSAGDSKTYPTHPQWTSDGKWIIFRSNRVKGEAMAVNEKSGVLIQVTEGGYTGTLCMAQKSMKLYFMRSGLEGKMQIMEVNLANVFDDSKSGKMKPVAAYERVCGITNPEMGASGDMALDADEEKVYFRIGKEEAAKHLAAGTVLEKNFGPRNMGAGPGGIASMNLKTGEFKHVISVPFQIGHIQSNIWNPGELVFCWETGGKSPQRTWTVMSDGTGLRPLYPESDFEWVTHEVVISKDEVAMAIMGHRKINIEKDPPVEVAANGEIKNPVNPGQESNWGATGTREKPTGLAIVNLRTREMIIAGQTKSGSGLWHVHGSSDGRWAVGDDFSRSLYLIDRKTNEMMMLTTGHKETAADHLHPTFNRDGTKIEIQSAMLSEDNRTMNICIVNVPKDWLKRKTK
jgi:oligogalacturonide lyase